MTAAARALVERTTQAQGLPMTLEDAGAIARVLALLRADPRQQSGPGPKPEAAKQGGHHTAPTSILHRGCTTSPGGGA